MSGRWRSVRSLPAPSLFVPLRPVGFLNLFFEPAQVRYSGHITYGRVRMDGTTGQGQFSVDLRQHPRLRVSAPFVCSFSRLGLAKWLGRGGDGIGVVFDVSMRGAKVMSESGIQRDACFAQSGVADDGGGSDGALGVRAGVRIRVCRSVTSGRDALAKVHYHRDEAGGITARYGDLSGAVARRRTELRIASIGPALRPWCVSPNRLLLASSRCGDSPHRFEIALAAPFPYNGFPIRPCPVRTHERSGSARIVPTIRCIGRHGSVSDCFACWPCFPTAGNLHSDGNAGVCCMVY